MLERRVLTAWWHWQFWQGPLNLLCSFHCLEIVFKKCCRFFWKEMMCFNFVLDSNFPSSLPAPAPPPPPFLILGGSRLHAQPFKGDKNHGLITHVWDPTVAEKNIALAKFSSSSSNIRDSLVDIGAWLSLLFFFLSEKAAPVGWGCSSVRCAAGLACMLDSLIQERV